MAERDAYAATRNRPAIALATDTAARTRTGDDAAEPATAPTGRARAVMKALTWRCTATIDTFIISYLVTGKLSLAGAIISIEVVTKLVVYYLHERAWESLARSRMRP